jgi:hypothetical protein
MAALALKSRPLAAALEGLVCLPRSPKPRIAAFLFDTPEICPFLASLPADLSVTTASAVPLALATPTIATATCALRSQGVSEAISRTVDS